jgi:FkbH-like protein
MKKALIFDCDNTLWSGVIGEGDITIDRTMYDTIVFLAMRGVIIGVCSKNNEADVEEVLKELSDYISARRINWKDKASNLKEIIAELNIGSDTVVFVDDSEFERGLVSSEIPDVLCVHPKELMKTVNENFNLTGDLTKTQQYKENYARAKYQEQFTDIEDYLRSLDMVLDIRVNDRDQVSRIAELTQKTNQFNLTTIRYTEHEIKNFMAYPFFTYTVSVRDKFGDNGLTGVCIIRGTNIDVFLLSCRILGRNIEYAFFDCIISDLKKRGYIALIGKYIPSQKNGQTKDFYGNLGFEAINVTKEVTTFTLILNDYVPKQLNYFRYE